MADDRMFLLHVPTGLALSVGKKYRDWRCQGVDPEALFNEVEAQRDPTDSADDYAIVRECDDHPMIEWEYSKGNHPESSCGLVRLKVLADWRRGA